MKIIERNRIDIQRYNQLLQEYGCTEAAMQPWVLDAVSPQWAMLCNNDGEYLMPLPIRHKFYIPYLTMPIFGQRFQILSPKDTITKIILSYLKRKYFRASISFANENWHNSDGVLRQTYHLDLNPSYDQLLKGMSKGHRKNILEAKRMSEVVRKSEGANLFYRMKMTMLEQREVKISAFDRMGYYNLIQTAIEQKKCPFYMAFHDGEMVAAALFICINNRFVIESATLPLGRKYMAGYALIDKFIQDYAQSNCILDFAGSSIPSIASFNSGFGASQSQYINVQWRWV